MPELVVRGSSLGFSLGSLIFIPELAFALLSFSAQAQMLLIGLGPNHAYSIGSKLGSQ